MPEKKLPVFHNIQMFITVFYIIHFPCNYIIFTKEQNQLVAQLISDFHRASLLLVTFINQLMHSIITVVDVKIYAI
jgi:hypothetical protein